METGKVLDEDAIANCVCFFRLALCRPDGAIVPIELKLSKIFRLYCADWPLKYDPRQFGSANIKIECRSLGFKNVAALIFSTGKVVCPGPRSVPVGLVMAHLITREVSNILRAPLCMRDFQLTNVVAKIHTAPIDLRSMVERLGDAVARYKPNGDRAFPACFVFPHRNDVESDRVVYLVFRSGKVVITGCKSKEDAIKNQRAARALCECFPLKRITAQDEPPSAIAAADIALLDTNNNKRRRLEKKISLI